MIYLNMMKEQDISHESEALESIFESEFENEEEDLTVHMNRG